MARTRLTRTTLPDALKHLARVDPDMKSAMRDWGKPELRRTKPGFEALLRAIIGQQVSVHAARAIWERLAAAQDGAVAPEKLMALSDADLRAVGLSRQKIAYGRDLASKFLDGTLHHRRWGRMEDEAIIEELTQVKGIGRWSAEIYLMFAMQRPDVMPGGDLGLVVAAQHMKGLKERPKPAELVEIAEPWRPWRSAAALMLWHYNHNMPAMDG